MTGRTEPEASADDQFGATLVTSAGDPAKAPEIEVTAPRVGRYSILRRVGAGAMGVVFAAYDEQLDRKVAIKLLRRSGERDQARLIREARGLARLSHPNVVQIYEICKAVRN